MRQILSFSLLSVGVLFPTASGRISCIHLGGITTCWTAASTQRPPLEKQQNVSGYFLFSFLHFQNIRRDDWTPTTDDHDDEEEDGGDDGNHHLPSHHTLTQSFLMQQPLAGRGPRYIYIMYSSHQGHSCTFRSYNVCTSTIKNNHVFLLGATHFLACVGGHAAL